MGTSSSPLELRSAVICKQSGRYMGWPTIARTPAGELLVTFSGDREWHVCPFGKTQLIRSRDDGATWSDPETVTDSPLDDRDAGIHALRSGALLVNWFTSVAFENESRLTWMRQVHPRADELFESWRPHAARITPQERQLLGCWTRRSEDNGRTWEGWSNSHVGSPHGPTQLSDGRLLYLGRGVLDDKPILGASESNDDGRTWQLVWHKESTAEERPLCELHQAELQDGRVVAMIRYDIGPDHYLWQMESEDGGYSWSSPRVTEIWGLPPHLLVLRDGRLLCTFGHRRVPYGQRACLSQDGGRTWDYEREIVIRDDAPSDDLGYPASVEMDDASVLTVYYQQDFIEEPPCLMATRWRPPKARKGD